MLNKIFFFFKLFKIINYIRIFYTNSFKKGLYLYIYVFDSYRNFHNINNSKIFRVEEGKNA